MKIRPEHVEHLKMAIDGHYGKDCLAEMACRYSRGEFINSDRVCDLQKRFCFDIMYGVPGLCDWVCVVLYPYANDEHIYTALKSFLPKVERKY